MFRIEAKLTLPSVEAMLEHCGLEKGGRVQKAIDQAVIDYCNDGGYVPASPDRTLESSAQLSTEIGDGMVIWNTPYAHYQYMGIVYGPNYPIIDSKTGVLLGYYSPPQKKPTDRKLTYDKAQNPNAGPFWFERMKADHLDDIIRHAEAAMKGGE